MGGGYYCAEMLFLVLGGDSRAEIHHFTQIEFLLMLKSKCYSLFKEMLIRGLETTHKYIHDDQRQFSS